MFSRAEAGAWLVAIIGVVIMGIIALHGPFGHVNVVQAVGGSKVRADINLTEAHLKIMTDPNTIGRYVPATLRVRARESIIIVNDSSAPHSVTDRANRFNIGNIAEGDSSVLSINKPGTYHYYCIYHPGMHGTIIVTPR